MTSPNQNLDDRDEVLYAFHEACDRPTADQISEWTRRYPQFADDIRAHAAVAREWDARKDLPAVSPDENMLARGHSRILNALYNAAVASDAGSSSEPCQSFQQMMAAKATDVPRLARQLDIARSVLADLVNGAMLAPAGRKLMNALSAALAVPREFIEAAHRRALTVPRLGHAKADRTPTVIPRSYEEIIRSSNMTAERMQYWLADD